jgi:hypothetical protein
MSDDTTPDPAAATPTAPTPIVPTGWPARSSASPEASVEGAHILYAATTPPAGPDPAPSWAQQAGHPDAAGTGTTRTATRVPVQPAAADPGPASPGAAVSWMDADLDDGRPAGPVAPAAPSAGARRRPGMIVAAAIAAGALAFGGYAVGHVFGGSGTAGTALTGQQAPGVAAQQGQGLQGGQDLQGGQAAQGGQGGPPGGPGGFDDGTMTVGQVTAVDGSTLTLAGRDGSTTTVTTTSATTVDGVAGDLSGLSTGALVFVQGSAAADGTWAATSITTTPAGGGTGPGQGAGQDAGQGTQSDTDVTT